MTAGVLTAPGWAATDQPGQAGPLGLFVILLLALATALLIRSMGRHLRQIPSSFDPPDHPVPDHAAPGRVEEDAVEPGPADRPPGDHSGS